MKMLVLMIVLLLSLPTLAIADKSVMHLVDVKKNSEGRIFQYICNENSNTVNVEQKYNPKTKLEDVRFVVDEVSSEWITGGMIFKKWTIFAQNSCERSPEFFGIAPEFNAKKE